MTLHVFVGAGPANLHRALKIQNIDLKARFVFIDDRLNPITRSIDRVSARANIFRFETEDVTAKMLADGVKEEELNPLICQRDFSVQKGFQLGDDKVFSNKPFTQIQIRDLQLLLLKTIDDKSGAIKPLLLQQKAGLNPEKSLEEEVVEILYQNNISPEEASTLKIHVAVGSLTGDARKNEIIYPDKVTYKIEAPTDDLASMTVTPLHGTTTFLLNNKVTVETLMNNQRSLDLTRWAPALKYFGWVLVRPPRIRVFYANDILYIGTEIPSGMKELPKEPFEAQLTAYTREIARLVFPDLPINTLRVNPYLQSRFFTSRGERGDVINNKFHQKMSFGKQFIETNITTLTHGDSRYLPHYQTGSGFVTAFLQNELYAEIYVHQSFDALINWAVDTNHLDKNINRAVLKTKYSDLVHGDMNLALETFKQELFMALSREIISENKQKVARYFNVLHEQGFNYTDEGLLSLEAVYNNYHGTSVEFLKNQPSFPGTYLIIKLLSTDNIDFLRFILPKLLNMNFTDLNDRDVLNIRDIHVLDFKKNLDEKNHQISYINSILDNLHSDKRIKYLEYGVQHFDTLLQDYNEAYKLNYKAEDFSKINKKVMIMEMLNSKEENVHFLRQALSLLLQRDLSTASTADVLGERNWFTTKYPGILGDFYTSIIAASSVKNNEDELIRNLTSGDMNHFAKVCEQLKLPQITKESDAYNLRINLLYAAIFQTKSDNDFYSNMKEMIKRNQIGNDIRRIADALEINDALHQRAALPFFKGRHSDLIQQLIKDLEALHTNYCTYSRLQYCKQLLDIVMTFYFSLEQAKSRRTIKMFNELMHQAFSPAIKRNLLSIPLSVGYYDVFHYELLITPAEEAGLINNLARGDMMYFNKICKRMRLGNTHGATEAENLRKMVLYAVLPLIETSNPFHKTMQEMIKDEDNVVIKLQRIAHSLTANKTLHHRDLLSLFKGKHSNAINQFAKDIDSLVEPRPSHLSFASKQRINAEALAIVMRFHSDLDKNHSRRTLASLNDLVNQEFSGNYRSEQSLIA